MDDRPCAYFASSDFFPWPLSLPLSYPTLWQIFGISNFWQTQGSLVIQCQSRGGLVSFLPRKYWN